MSKLNDYEIELVQSHGDFQPANILVDNIDQQLYLIDWEYTAKRSVHYDALVFASQCRFPQELSERVRSILNETNVSWNWCIKNASTKLSKLELIIFLIEDLIVRLFELQIPNMINKDSGLDIYFPEDITVPARESKKIKLGIACEAFRNQTDKDAGHSCAFYLYPRSSISRTPIRLANSVGIIDSGYRGEHMVVVDNMNIGGDPYHIEKGKRLFQICAPDLSPFEHVEVVDELSLSERGHGGGRYTDG